MNLTDITIKLNTLADKQGNLDVLEKGILAAKEELRRLRAEVAQLRREALSYKGILEKAHEDAQKEAGRIKWAAEKEAEELLLDAKDLLEAAKRVKPESTK